MADEQTEDTIDDIDIELTTDMQDMIKNAVKPIVKAAGTVALVIGATKAIEKLTTTNHKKSNLKGDTDYKPTEDKVSMSKVESSASDVDASLSKDEVTGVDGDLSAAQTEGKALTGEATALESGAAAARTKAGAADIETKALKMT